MSDRYSYCKIFVASPTSDELKTLLSQLFHRKFSRNSMQLPTLIIDVRVNPDSDPSLTDFVRWPVTVEVETTGSDSRTMVDTIKKILECLWTSGSSAIAACDFEEELPYSGGILGPPTQT